jgi:hypothetical protein
VRDRPEAGRLELPHEVVGLRELGAVNRLERRKERAEPVAVEVVPVEGGDHESSVWPEDTPCFRERLRPVDEVDDEPHHGPLEPAVLEREPLGRRHLDRAHALPRAGSHLRLRLDAPDPGPAVGQRGSDPARPAPDVEDPPPDEVALANEQLEDLPPVVVGRAQLVVPARNPAEIRPVRRRSPRAR